MKVRITGEGMAADYLRREFAPELRATEELEKKEGKIPCELLIIATDDRGEESAFRRNLEETERLLESLGATPPRQLVLISTWEVYGPVLPPRSGEETPLRPSGAYGKSKARAEESVRNWCESHGTVCTILRPARMFGEGMEGEMDRFFREVLSNRFISVRESEGKLSLVTAYDVARAARKLYAAGGVYNLADGKERSWKELAEGMSANAGAMKRMPVLTRSWAGQVWKWLRFIPAVADSLSPETIALRDRVQTLDAARAREAGVEFFDTLSVLSRTQEGYPYLEP